MSNISQDGQEDCCDQPMSKSRSTKLSQYGAIQPQVNVVQSVFVTIEFSLFLTTFAPCVPMKSRENPEEAIP